MRKPQVTTLDQIWHSDHNVRVPDCIHCCFKCVTTFINSSISSATYVSCCINIAFVIAFISNTTSCNSAAYTFAQKKYCVIFSKAQIPTPPKFLPSSYSIPSCCATQCNASHMLLPYTVHRRLCPQPLYNSPLFLRFALALLSGFQARPHLHGRVEILEKVFPIS